MGILDLLSWMEASEASKAARNSMKKLEAMDKKLDLIAEAISELQKNLQK
jgi:hypothetical protein